MQSDTPSHPPSRHYKWYVVAMLWWISFFNYADRQALSAVLPLLEKEMHLTQEQLGGLISAFAWVYGLCAPFAGNIVDRVRRKSAILWGLQVWSIICMATAISQRYWHLWVFRAAEGLGETFYYPAATSMVSDYHGKQTRSRALGLHQTSVYAGTIGGSFFAGLIGMHYGWRWSFVVFGAMGVILGIILHRFLREPVRGAMDRAEGVAPPPENRRGFREFWRVLQTTPTVFFLMIAFMCANFVAMVMLAWFPMYLTKRFELDVATAAWTATLYVQVSSMVGAYLGGWLADGLRKHWSGGRIAAQAIGVLLAAPCIYWVGSAESLNWLIPAFIGLGLFKGFYDANIFAAVFDVVRPEARGTTAGFMNMIGWLIGGGIAPIITGILADRYSLGYAISLTAVVYLVAFVVLITAAIFVAPRDVKRMEQPS